MIKEFQKNSGQMNGGGSEVCKALQNNMYYEGHHIIQLDHGGQNVWWNLIPLHAKDHIKTHSREGTAYQIFRKVIKKE
jgi:5-methylcytosine-specific restriction endonuclease McrA